MIRTCAECIHRTEDRTFLQAQQAGQPEWVCRHPAAMTRDVVTGLCYCRAERESARAGACGKSGKLWEAKKSSA